MTQEYFIFYYIFLSIAKIYSYLYIAKIYYYILHIDSLFTFTHIMLRCVMLGTSIEKGIAKICQAFFKYSS